MLYFKSFRNYEEFKNVFGLRECGNGNKSRMNKILLGCLKDKQFFHYIMEDKEYEAILKIGNMSEFKNELLFYLSSSSQDADGYSWSLPFNGVFYMFHVPNMQMDNDGFCMDGDTRALRYFNTENKKFFKMKAGKFFTKIMESCEFGQHLPQQAKSWLGEEFLTSWEAYAEAHMPDKSFEFHYGNEMKDFEEIYSSRHRRGDFHSCMTDKKNYSMYYDACKCHAAWLTDADGNMFARCIVFDEVYDEATGEILRLAERQYSDGVQDKFKKMLVDALISRDLIDGYKQIGASCSDNQNFVLNDGTDISDHDLSIDCDLYTDSTVSYMDSFVYYSIHEHKAYNSCSCDYTHTLDTTDGVLEGPHKDEVWSGYNNAYIPQDEAYFVDRHDDYFYDNQVVIDHYDDYQLIDDCEQCAECDDWYLRDDMIQEEGLPDDLYFCDTECAKDWASKNDYVWSDYDEMYLDADDAVRVNRYHKYYGQKEGYWKPETISEDDFDYSRDEMHELDGEWYWLESMEAEEAYKSMTLPALVVA